MLDVLDVTTRHLRDRVTIAVRGELDVETAPNLEAAFEKAFASRPRRIAIDLSALEFCDSSGLRVLVTAHRRCVDGDVELGISPPTGQAVEALRVSGLADVLPLI